MILPRRVPNFLNLNIDHDYDMSEQPTASSSNSKPPTPPDVADIEKLLSREATAFQREVEVDRILKAFKLKCVCTTAVDA